MLLLLSILFVSDERSKKIARKVTKPELVKIISEKNLWYYILNPLGTKKPRSKGFGMRSFANPQRELSKVAQNRKKILS